MKEREVMRTRTELEVRRIGQEAVKSEQEKRKKEQEARKREMEARKREMEARKKELEANKEKREQEIQRKEQEAIRKEEREAGKREEGAGKHEGVKWKELEARRKNETPDIDTVCARLFMHLQATETSKKLVGLQGHQAQEMMDLLQNVRLVFCSHVHLTCLNDHLC